MKSEMPAAYRLDALPEHLRSKIRVNAETGCWEWQGSTTADGYGLVGPSMAEGSRLVHRIVYARLVGAIPVDAPQLDHVWNRGCRSRQCCWPAHLEPVTNFENSRRGHSHNATKSACAKGHPFTPENTRQRPCGRRACRACDRERDQERRRRACQEF